ncbi:MAG: PAS domain S-box protein [Bacteroidota bacterium]|nr:PAS domain S-box protein [Bacteroidota bacterium]
MSLYTFLSGCIIGLLLLSAVFSLFVASRDLERRLNIWFVFFAVAISGAVLHGLLITQATDLRVLLFHERMVNTALVLSGAAFIFLVSALTGYHARIFNAGMLVLFLVALVANWMLPYGLTWGTVRGMETQQLFWGETVMGLDAVTGKGNILAVAILLGLILYTIRAIVYQVQKGQRTYARLLLAASVVGLFGILLDALLNEFNAIALGVVDDVGIFAFIVLIGHRNLAMLLRSNDLLRESEERFSMLTDAAFEGIVFTEKAVVLDINRQLAEMLGYTVEEVIGKPVMHFVAPESQRRVREQMEAVHEPVYEHLAMRKDGSAFPVEVRVKNIAYRDRTVRVTAIRDITERRRAEEENTLLAQTLKSVRDCISITDSEDRIMFINDAFLATYGYAEDEVLGRHVSVLRPANVAPEKTQGIFPSTREGGWHGEVLNRRKDGTEFPVELWTSVVRDQSGKPVAYVGVARDISDRKFAEQAIIAEKERAERSDRLKDAFIANISHEVRTPLNIILGYTGLIGEKMEGRADEEERGYYQSVQRGAQRLQRTVDMILSISRLQVGDIHLEPKEIDLAALLHDIIGDYRAMAEDKSLSLTLAIDTAETRVHADEYCIAQTVQNLIDNAIKYTQRGGVTLCLARTAEGHVRIEVRDTGIGISEEYLPLLFEPYTQEESGYTRSFEGIGLGMSLVKKYAELIGAGLSISSEKNRGTTVAVTFGVMDRDIVAEPVLAADGGEDAEAQDALPTVLLVEDERLTVEYMSTLLRNHVQLRFAESAAEAWAVLEREHVDLVFMDISLSGEQSGLDITREIRADSRLATLPVVAVTAHGFAHDRTRCLDAGCDAYLLKPVGQEDLLDTIRALVPARRRLPRD